MPLDDFAHRFSQRFPHLIGHRILVALSGGPDSVSLLHLLRDPRLELELEAAHVHHSVRGDEADRDAAFCRRLCDELSVGFHLVRLEPRRAAPEGREAGWRLRRYEALLEIKARTNAAAVATGHHRDDVAEGVLMQLLRGAGPRALAGIAAETSEGVLRPLLDWSRAQIIEWLQEENLQWREDSSNRDLSYLRNRVRHIILPDLRGSSPQIDSHLVAFARALAADEAYFAAQLRQHAHWIEPWAADGGVATALVTDLDRPLRSRWLHAQAARVGIGKVSRRQVELFHQLVEDGTPRAVTLARRWRLRLARGRLWLEPPQSPPAYAIELEVGASVPLPLPGWRARVHASFEPESEDSWHHRASEDGRLTLRSAEPGDVVLTGERPTKVSRMVAKAAPRHLRRSWPVLCENDTITWIPGVWQGPMTGNLLVEVTAHGGPAGSVHR
jgi:tRNA(Ile)-lysidine synthase